MSPRQSRNGIESIPTGPCLENGTAFNSELFIIARQLVRIADEDKKDNAERLREYRQSNRDSLEQQLFSEAPIYDDLETVKLGDSLSMFMEQAGADNQWVRKTLETARRKLGPMSSYAAPN